METSTTPEEFLSAMLNELEAADNAMANDLGTTLQCAEIAGTHLRELENWLQEKSFDDAHAEITVFKRLKPQMEGRLLYYLRLLSIQQRISISEGEELVTFLQAESSSITEFYAHHKKDYLYFQLEQDHQDNYFFRRTDHPLMAQVEKFSFWLDKRLHSPKSHLFSCFIANDLLRRYLQSQLQMYKRTGNDPGLAQSSLVTWTGSQAALTELLYALNELGVINGGRQEINKIKIAFEILFNTSLGNIYKTYEHNRIRKKSRTPFLDNAIMALQRRYDHDDEHALG